LPWFTALAQTAAPAERLIPVAERALRALEPLAPVYDARSLDAVVDETTAPTRYAMTLVALVAVVALVLTAAGTYGLGAFASAERRREVAVRIALGASGAHVFGLIVRKAVGPAIVGLFLGGLLAALSARLADVAVYGVSLANPVFVWTSVLLLLTTAVAAALVPARRALSVDPSATLRAE
jgi:ABC-type antimicrobial peptide transport system permease subunit